jgi:hypothetical protein
MLDLLGQIRRPRYVFEGDGLATAHFSPFLGDREFDRLYAAAPPTEWDPRWRYWLVTRFAHRCRSLPGSFAEFGVYQGRLALQVLATTDSPAAPRVYLFDTFAGIPSERLTPREAADGLAGSLADTSVEQVERLLEPWRSRIVICPGDVFDTLTTTETGSLSFVHIDLEPSAATARSLEYAYARLVTEGAIVLDGYGRAEHEDQRGAIDAFFAGKPEEVIALPTGQAVVIRDPDR